MKYDFDEIVNRYGTSTIKWGIAENVTNEAAYAKKETITDWSYTNPQVALPFMIADMDFRCAPSIQEAVHKVADRGIYGYSVESDTPAYKQSLMDWYEKHFKVTLKEEWVDYANGSVKAIENIIRTFTKVGDGIIICRPLYGHFNETILDVTYRKVANCQLINTDGYYTVDWDDFEKVCAVPENRVFILSSPANPTGRVWSVEELQKFVEITRKNHVLLICDEVHADIVRKGVVQHSILSVTDDYSNIFVVYGTNKTFNLAGLQCSNTIIPDSYLRGNYLKTKGMEIVNPFAIEAQIAAFTEGEEWVAQVNDYIDENIDKSIAFIHEHLPKVKVWRPEGTYCLWLDFRAYGLTDEEVHDRIYNQALVILQDGIVHDPGMGQCFQRIVIATSWKLVEEALKRIEKVFEK